MCGDEVQIDLRGGADCAQHHRRDQRDLWLQARASQLISEVDVFLYPTDAAPVCAGHAWVLTERIVGVDVLECRRCRALSLADGRSGGTGR
jgi:hypothetical protein